MSIANNVLVDEFRGTDELYIAEILTDNNEVAEGYTFNTPIKLAPVAEISKSVETSSETKYYDNAPAMVINAEGADTINLTVPTLPLDMLAYITGKQIDEDTGAFLDGQPVPRYFALGYRLGLTDGTYRYVWRYKGSFGIPDETSATKNGGTDSNNQSLTYTGITTQHKFEKALDAVGNPMPQKALVVDERDGKAELGDFFETVTTCDTLQPLTPPVVSEYSVTNTLTHVSNSNGATKVSTGSAYTGTLTADDNYTISTVTVTMGGEDITNEAYAEETVTIASVTGAVVITAVAVQN